MRWIGPTVESIHAELSAEGMNWKTALSELIDNSFDAGATRIEVSIQKNSLSIWDDGDGCDDPGSMLQKGYSAKRTRPGRQLGRFGVGLKHASFYFCKDAGSTRIATVRGGKLRTVAVRWGDILTRGEWMIDDNTEYPATHETTAAFRMPESKGTIIEFEVKRQKQNQKDMEATIRDLEFTFMPAISSGRQIAITTDKRRLLAAPKLEKLHDEISDTISVGGKSALVRVGIVPEGQPNPRQGISYFYGHRVIVRGTSHGCGDYSVSRISGTVELVGSWGLSTNKNEIHDDDYAALGDAVLQLIRPILEKAQSQTVDLLSQSLSCEVEKLLNEVGKQRRPGPSKKTGSVAPQATARKTRNAARVSGVGDCRGPRKASSGAIKIEWVDDPDRSMIQVDPGGCRVYVNRHFEYVARIQKTENRDALAALVVATYWQDLIASERVQKRLFCLGNDVGGMTRPERFRLAIESTLNDCKLCGE